MNRLTIPGLSRTQRSAKPFFGLGSSVRGIFRLTARGRSYLAHSRVGSRHLAYAIANLALITAHTDGTLPTVSITKTTFKDVVGGKAARRTAIEDLIKAGLIEVDAPRDGVTVWTLCVGAEPQL